MTAAPKLCRECAHFSGGPAESCDAPQNQQPESKIDYVNGIGPSTRRIWYGAQYCREDSKACGPDAKWWEEKQ